MRCVECRGKLPKEARSSICDRCMKRMAERDRDDPDGYDEYNSRPS
jgi:hypothetical protein